MTKTLRLLFVFIISPRPPFTFSHPLTLSLVRREVFRIVFCSLLFLSVHSTLCCTPQLLHRVLFCIAHSIPEKGVGITLPLPCFVNADEKEGTQSHVNAWVCGLRVLVREKPETMLGGGSHGFVVHARKVSVLY